MTAKVWELLAVIFLFVFRFQIRINCDTKAKDWEYQRYYTNQWIHCHMQSLKRGYLRKEPSLVFLSNKANIWGSQPHTVSGNSWHFCRLYFTIRDVNYPSSKDGWACNWLLQYKRNLLCRFSWTLTAGILPSVPLHHRVVDSTRLTAFRIYRNLSLLF